MCVCQYSLLEATEPEIRKPWEAAPMGAANSDRDRCHVAGAQQACRRGDESRRHPCPRKNGGGRGTQLTTRARDNDPRSHTHTALEPTFAVSTHPRSSNRLSVDPTLSFCRRRSLPPAPAAAQRLRVSVDPAHGTHLHVSPCRDSTQQYSSKEKTHHSNLDGHSLWLAVLGWRELTLRNWTWWEFTAFSFSLVGSF